MNNQLFFWNTWQTTFIWYFEERKVINNMNSIKEIIDTYWYLNWYSLVSEQIYKILPKFTNINVFWVSLYMQVTAHQKYIATS